jgi:glutathione S-transferase
LASKYSPQQWWPTSPERLGEVTSWLAFAANEIANGPAAIRLVHKFGVTLDEATARTLTDKVFSIVDSQLSGADRARIKREEA